MSKIAKRLTSAAATPPVNLKHDIVQVLEVVGKGSMKQSLLRGSVDKLFGYKQRIKYLSTLITLGAFTHNAKGGNMVALSDNGRFLLAQPIDWTAYTKAYDILPDALPDKERLAQQILFDQTKLRLPKSLLDAPTPVEAVAEQIAVASAPEEVQAPPAVTTAPVPEEKPAPETPPTPRPTMQRLTSFDELRTTQPPARTATPYAELLAELRTEFTNSREEESLHRFLRSHGYDPLHETEFLSRTLRLLRRERVAGIYPGYRATDRLHMLIKSGVAINRNTVTRDTVEEAVQPQMREANRLLAAQDLASQNREKMQLLLDTLCTVLTDIPSEVDVNALALKLGFKTTIISKLIYLKVLIYRHVAGQHTLYNQSWKAARVRDARINWAVHSIYMLEEEDLRMLVDMSRSEPEEDLPRVPAVVAAIAAESAPTPAKAPAPAMKAAVAPVALPPVLPAATYAEYRTVIPSVIIDPSKLSSANTSKSVEAVANRFMAVLVVLARDLSLEPAAYNIGQVYQACQVRNTLTDTLKNLGLLRVEVLSSKKVVYSITQLCRDAVEYNVDLTKHVLSKMTQLQFHTLVEEAKAESRRCGGTDHRSHEERENHCLALSIKLEELFPGERLVDLQAALAFLQETKPEGRI
jgi:hypothetical protein